MPNALISWLIENWDLIVELFMWGVTLLMAFVLATKIYKIIKLDFEAKDLVGTFFSGLWLLVIISFGFNHLTQYLQSLI